MRASRTPRTSRARSRSSITVRRVRGGVSESIHRNRRRSRAPLAEPRSPVRAWGNTEALAEHAAEMRRAAKAPTERDLGDRAVQQLRARQILAATVEPQI